MTRQVTRFERVLHAQRVLPNPYTLSLLVTRRAHQVHRALPYLGLAQAIDVALEEIADGSWVLPPEVLAGSANVSGDTGIISKAQQPARCWLCDVEIGPGQEIVRAGRFFCSPRHAAQRKRLARIEHKVSAEQVVATA